MKLEFVGTRALIQQDFITTEDGGRIPLELYAEKEPEAPDGVIYAAFIDGVLWYAVENVTHAMILYKLLKEHVTEYMKYETFGGVNGSSEA